MTYFASEFEARLVEASRLPSERGNDSLLGDALKDAMGNAIGPVSGDKEGGAVPARLWPSTGIWERACYLGILQDAALANAVSNAKHEPFLALQR